MSNSAGDLTLEASVKEIRATIYIISFHLKELEFNTTITYIITYIFCENFNFPFIKTVNCEPINRNYLSVQLWYIFKVHHLHLMYKYVDHFAK